MHYLAETRTRRSKLNLAYTEHAQNCRTLCTIVSVLVDLRVRVHNSPVIHFKGLFAVKI